MDEDVVLPLATQVIDLEAGLAAAEPQAQEQQEKGVSKIDKIETRSEKCVNSGKTRWKNYGE